MRDRSINSFRLGRFSGEPRGGANAQTNNTERIECDPSFRMAERVSPLRPLSMMAFQATAEGGDRIAVVIDKGLSGEKNASMRTMAQ